MTMNMASPMPQFYSASNLTSGDETGRMYVTATSPGAKKLSVARRNERERRRIKHVNTAFDELRKRVPCGNRCRKISKVETLRSAIEYIRALEEILERQQAPVTSNPGVDTNHDTNVVWYTDNERYSSSSMYEPYTSYTALLGPPPQPHI